MRMIQKKEPEVQMTQRRQSGRSYIRNSVSTVLMILLVNLSSTKVISGCIISPSESVVIVGDRSTLSCNSRPNNQPAGSVSNIKLGSDTTRGIDIFRPASYDPKGQVITRECVADGYFLSHLDASYINATIQINETQLRNGGPYFCSCVDSTSNLGKANITVLDGPSFEWKALTPGAQIDLTCSVSFNGSTSSTFMDLTISDANGVQVATEKNLPLISHVTGDYHVVHGRPKIVADQKEERFTCEMKIWKKSEKNPLHSRTSSLTIDQVTTTPQYSNSTTSQATGRTTSIITSIVFGVIAIIYT